MMKWLWTWIKPEGSNKRGRLSRCGLNIKHLRRHVADVVPSNNLQFTRLSDHPKFLDLVKRAGRIVNSRGTNQLNDEASLQIKENSHVLEMDREIGAETVRDIRRHLESYRFGSNSVCAFCYVLEGISEPDHKYYVNCTKITLGGQQWLKYHKEFSLPKGTSCFKCFLPTVSFCVIRFT